MSSYYKNLIKILIFILSAAILVSSLEIPAQALYGDEPELNSPVILLYETHSREVLFSRAATQRVYPASTTKIMTALIALKYCDMDEIVTYTRECRANLDSNSSIAGLKLGEYMTMQDMLKCLLIASGNDAANAIAVHVGGSISRFVEMMNEEAAELGCEDTHFANAHGLHDDDHYTTAEDMLKITLAAREYDLFRDIVKNGQVTVPATNKYSKPRVFNNTNMLLSGASEGMYLYSKATGIKTGHTSQAGYCLVSSAENDNFEFICLVFGGFTYHSDIINADYTTSYQDSLRLYRWAFTNFKWYNIFTTGSMVTEIKVEQGEDKDHLLLSPTEDVRALIHKSQDPEKMFSYVISAAPTLTAPIEKGTVHGTVTVMRENEVFKRVNLVAASSIKASSVIQSLNSIKQFFSGAWFTAIVILVVLAVVLYGVFLIYYNSRRSKRRRRRRRR